MNNRQYLPSLIGVTFAGYREMVQGGKELKEAKLNGTSLLKRLRRIFEGLSRCRESVVCSRERKQIQ